MFLETTSRETLRFIIRVMMIKEIKNVQTHSFNSLLPLSFSNRGNKEFVLDRNCCCLRVRKGSIYYREHFDGFFAKNFSCAGITTR